MILCIISDLSHLVTAGLKCCFSSVPPITTDINRIVRSLLSGPSDLMDQHQFQIDVKKKEKKRVNCVLYKWRAMEMKNLRHVSRRVNNR